MRNFLDEINQIELIDNNEIKYIYNSQQILFKEENKYTAGEFFINDNNPVVFVRDINNLMRPIDITFKTSQGCILNLTINENRTVEYLLIKYISKIEHPELIDINNKIVFLYKAKHLMFGDKTIIKNLFLNDNNPTILVMDANNVLSNNAIHKINAFFYLERGNQKNEVINYGTTVEQLIKFFLYKNCPNDIIDSYYSNENPRWVTFRYNSKSINPGEKRYVEEFFPFQTSARIYFNFK